MKYALGNHTIEFKYGASAPDPWTVDYCREIGIACLGTNDCRAFIRLDGEEIHTIRRSAQANDMIRSLEEGVVKTFDEFLFFYQEFFGGNYPPFSVSKKECDESKRQQEIWAAMTPAEQRKYIEEEMERRGMRRKENLEKAKEYERTAHENLHRDEGE